ncbi:MAG: response regulator, partial [Acidobacteriota bacterium]
LSICFGIIQAHRGEIRVNSREGQGTEFRIELPILREDSTARPAEENDQPNPAPAGKGARILVVDDEPTVAEVVAEALALDGHRVETAHDGEIALEKVRRIRFDVIITDLKMPGMTGQDFYLNIRQRDQNLARRVIFATGDIATVSTRKFLEESGNPFLQKPFEISAIRGIVLKVLEERN